MIRQYWAAEYASPSAFWVLLPALVLLALCLFRKKGNIGSLLLRTLALLLLTLALMDPLTQETFEERKLLALVDASHSVPEEAQAAYAELLKPYAEADTDLSLRVHSFAESVSQESFSFERDSDKDEFSSFISTTKSKINPGKTNIEAALRFASAESRSSTVLMLSDGRETVGESSKAFAGLQSLGLQIYPLASEKSFVELRGLHVSSFHAPLVVTAGDLVEIRVAVRNDSTTSEAGTLELWQENDKLYSNSVTVPPGEEKVVIIKSKPGEGGLQRLRATLQRGEKNKPLEAHRWLSVKNKQRILLLHGHSDDARIFGRLLKAKGYSIEEITADSSTAIPTTFLDYSSIVLNNVAKRQLPAQFLPNLEKYVEGGGGLLVIGGERSFGLGGYVDTPLEKISPVQFVPPQTKKRRVNSAVALVLDKSRSMVFEGKIQAAKAAAWASIKALKEDDYVSVIGFDSTPFVIIKMDRVPDVKQIAERRLRNLTAAGRTNLLPALSAARSQLNRAQAGRKHIIILSDGKIPDAGTKYVDELAKLRKLGVTISSVALGIEADVPFMKTLSRSGKGAFYHTLDASRLPEIFLHDIKVTTGEKTLKEDQKYVVEVGPSGLSSTSVKPYPTLLGYVETLPKRGANLELITSDAGKVYPILSSWDFGRGKTTVFTSDVNGRWSDSWVPWSKFSTFWSQVMESVRSRGKEGSGDIDFDLRYYVEKENVVLDFVVYDTGRKPGSFPVTSATVLEPGGGTKKLLFQQTAEGRYRGVIPRARSGDFTLNIEYGTLAFPPLAFTLPGDAFGEKRGLGLNIESLSRMAFETGGQVNPDPARLQPSARKTEKKTPLYPLLLILVFALVLFEAFVRELDGLLLPSFLRRRKSEGAELSRGTYEYRQRKRA